MQKFPERPVGCTDGFLSRTSRNLRLTWLAGGILLLVLAANHVQAIDVPPPAAYSVSLEWYGSPSADEVSGYRVYYGTASRTYSSIIDAGNVTNLTISGLSGGVTYFFAITAYNASGLESDLSDEVSNVPTVPTTPSMQTLGLSGGQFRLTVAGVPGHVHAIEATEDFSTWTPLGTVIIGANCAVSFTDENAANFPKRFYRSYATQP